LPFCRPDRQPSTVNRWHENRDTAAFCVAFSTELVDNVTQIAEGARFPSRGSAPPGGVS